MKIAVIALTTGGKVLAQCLANQLDAALLDKGERKFSATLAEKWNCYDAFICIMATGIVVRAVAPLLKDKATDPCVLVVDEKGKNVISLLSGHLGGGNALTLHVARLLRANPVITTASDTLELTALDLWAEQHHLLSPARPQLTALSARLVNSGTLHIYCDFPIDKTKLPADFSLTEVWEEADFILSLHKSKWQEKPLFHPRTVVIGTGCNRGTPTEEFEQALDEFCSELDIPHRSIRNLASIDAKSDECGLLEFAQQHSWQIDFFSKEQLNTFDNLDISAAVMKAVGAIGVAEPACLLSAGSNTLLARKRKWKNITMAAALAPSTLLVPAPAAGKI